MKTIPLHISGLHAEALSTHLILVLNNFVTGKKEGSIAAKDLELLAQLDQAYQKLNALTTAADDETPQKVELTIAEAEGLLSAFTAPSFKAAALADAYYQKASYSTYFEQIYSLYLRELGGRYVEVLAA
ncbi:MAG: hypothetical protein AAF798_00980 [Bacteroidota bacterium]